MLSLSLDGKRARAAVRSSPSSSLKAGHGVVAPSSARRVGRPERRMGRPIAVRRPAGRTISSVLDASATRPVGPSVGPSVVLCGEGTRSARLLSVGAYEGRRKGVNVQRVVKAVGQFLNLVI